MTDDEIYYTLLCARVGGCITSWRSHQWDVVYGWPVGHCCDGCCTYIGHSRFRYVKSVAPSATTDNHSIRNMIIGVAHVLLNVNADKFTDTWRSVLCEIGK